MNPDLSIEPKVTLPEDLANLTTLELYGNQLSSLTLPVGLTSLLYLNL